jgi:hypothetical protein
LRFALTGGRVLDGPLDGREQLFHGAQRGFGIAGDELFLCDPQLVLPVVAALGVDVQPLRVLAKGLILLVKFELPFFGLFQKLVELRLGHALAPGREDEQTSEAREQPGRAPRRSASRADGRR